MTGLSHWKEMAGWLKGNVTYGYFDEDLWVLIQNKVWRMKLRDYIIEKNWKRRKTRNP